MSAAGYLRRMSMLSRDVRLYLVASATVGFAILNGIYPVLFNLYLLRLGYGPQFVGLVNAVGLFGYALSALPSGVIASRLGLRRTMIVGVTVSAVCYGLQPLAELCVSPLRETWLLGSRLLAVVGLALFFVNSMPFLTSATGPEERSHAYSARMGIDTLSGFLGSLVGGALPIVIASLLGVTLSDPVPYRTSLFIAAVLCLPGVVALWAIRGGQETAARGVSDEAEPGRPMEAGPLPLGLLVLMALVVLLRSSSVGVSRTFLNVYLDDALGLSTGQIGLIFAVVQLASVPTALTMPVLARRWGHYAVSIAAALGGAVSMVPLALVPHWAAATLGRMGVYALSSIGDPALGVYQMDLVTPRWRSIMAGATAMALGSSWTLLAFGGGYMIASLGYRTLFLLAGALTAAGAVLFWAMFPRDARQR